MCLRHRASDKAAKYAGALAGFLFGVVGGAVGTTFSAFMGPIALLLLAVLPPVFVVGAEKELAGIGYFLGYGSERDQAAIQARFKTFARCALVGLLVGFPAGLVLTGVAS